MIGSELECHRDRDELEGKVRFYLGREDLRIAIGRAAQRRRITTMPGPGDLSACFSRLAWRITNSQITTNQNDSRMPRISVIMPVYNAAPYLPAAVQSVFDQTLQEWELIIVDDGSTDESLNIATAVRDPRVRLLRLGSNQGAAAAKNFGIEQVRSKFVAFLDADDVANPRRLERQLAVLEKVPNTIVGTRAEVIDANDQHLGFAKPLPTGNRFREMLLFRNCLVQSSIALGRESLHSLRFRSEFEPAEDYDLWVRLMDYCRIIVLEETLVRYRVHGRGVSARSPTRMVEAVDAIHRRLLSEFDPRLDPQLHRQIGEPPFPVSESWLRSVEVHLSRILATNTRFEAAALRAAVQSLWLAACQQAWTLGWKSLGIYHSSLLSRRTPADYFRLAWLCARSRENPFRQ